MEEEPADVRMRAVVPAIAEAVHRATNRVPTLLVDARAVMASQTGVVLQEKTFTVDAEEALEKACDCHM